MEQGVEAVPWEVDLRSELTAGAGTEVCVTWAVIGQGLAMVGPETDPQESPEGAWSEDGACVMGQAARGEAWEASAHDANWVLT